MIWWLKFYLMRLLSFRYVNETISFCSDGIRSERCQLLIASSDVCVDIVVVDVMAEFYFS